MSVQSKLPCQIESNNLLQSPHDSEFSLHEKAGFSLDCRETIEVGEDHNSYRGSNGSLNDVSLLAAPTKSGLVHMQHIDPHTAYAQRTGFATRGKDWV